MLLSYSLSCFDARGSGGGGVGTPTLFIMAPQLWCTGCSLPGLRDHPIHSHPDTVTQADIESIKSTSIYPGLKHLEQFQDSVWEGSRGEGGG